MACLQAAKYWPEACEIVGRPELATDERFADTASITANASVAHDLLAEVFAQHTVAEWREKLEPLLRPVDRRPGHAGGGRRPSVGGQRLRPGLRDGRRPHVPARRRAGAVRRRGGHSRSGRPEFNEHGDAILESIGLDMDAIIDLKVKGVVA